jgi:hypothetical protein
MLTRGIVNQMGDAQVPILHGAGIYQFTLLSLPRWTTFSLFLIAKHWRALQP